jgi:ABC-type polysaccharide/polyol phosphate export permease
MNDQKIINESYSFHKGLFNYFKNIYDRREMAWQFVKRDFRVKYRGSLLGYIWSLLGPILHASVYYCLIILIRGGGYDRQPLWLFGGIILFQFFRETLEGSMQSLTQNESLIKKIYFPREVFATSNMLAKLIFLILAMAPLIPLLYHYGFNVNYNQLYVPFSIIGAALLGLGIGYLLSCAHSIYSDVGLFMRYILTFLFFLSPVLWTIDRIPEKWLDLYLLINPIAVFLTMFRYGIEGSNIPIGNQSIAIALLISGISFILGVSVFKKFESGVIRYL